MNGRYSPMFFRVQALVGVILLLAALFSATASAQQRQPEYLLAAGDLIRISVFQNPTMTLETRVTENGSVTYPLVGNLKVGGLTIPSAEQTIADALRQGGYVKEPQVSIALLQNRGNQVSVLGQVNRPGRFPLETFNMRLSEVLAIAGGISATGAETAVVTGLRDGKPFRQNIDIAGMYLGSKLDEDLTMAGGDVIYVHRQPLFYIYGEVQRPGSYRIERNMTIQQALAQGGGPTNRGSERKLRLHRRGADGALKDLTPEMNDLVQSDDVLFVRESVF
jgi:polysaccharide export outer membrane protein